MCLVLKFDNGKVVSKTNEQTESQTDSCQHPVPYYNIDYNTVYIIIDTHREIFSESC